VIAGLFVSHPQAVFTLTLLVMVGAAAVAVAQSNEAMPQIPIVFVHGNGDSAALWQTTLWRFESNGYDPARLFAIDMRHPAAPRADTVPEANRSTTADQAAQLAGFVARILIETGAGRVVLVGNSRGGNTIRHYLKHGGGDGHVALAILCGAPNHGTFVSDEALDSEWNGRGRFLQRLNAGSEVQAGVRFVTIRSDRNDKYAQPSLGTAGTNGAMGAGHDSPALDGAENIVLDGLDHREVAYHPRAFREMYQAVTGHPPASPTIAPEPRPVLDGMVSGFANGDATNLPVAGADVAVYEVDPETGARRGPPAHETTTRFDGRWGPFDASPTAYYEFIVRADGYPTLHVFRTPFPRSSRYVHLRMQPIPTADAEAEAFVAMSRPRGYYGHGRDIFTMDGTVPDGVADGVPATSWVTRHFPAEPSRSVRLRFNDERLTVRTLPRSEGHLIIGEFHY